MAYTVLGYASAITVVYVIISLDRVLVNQAGLANTVNLVRMQHVRS